MLSIYGPETRLCDGWTRRELLRVGGLTALGINALPWLEAAAGEKSGSFGRAKACIVLFLLGGPPQHETWDPKPQAPDEVRGPFSPVATRVPGLAVCELMPRTASLVDRIAVLRAVSTDDNAHSSSGYWMLTGVPHSPKNFENAKPGFPNNHPCLGAVVRHVLGDRTALPAAIRLPEEIWNTGHIVWPGQDAGWLGSRADPWLITCHPDRPDFRVSDITLPGDVPPVRLEARQRLATAVNQHLDRLAEAAEVSRWDTLRQKALQLLSAPDVRRAFDLQSEPEAVRDRYGRNRFGQSVLLARRLVEAGVRFVQVNWTRWETDTADAPAWDTHARNAERLKEALMPPMDLAYSALLEELHERGMLDETLVVWMGEFGRTPRINPRGGRDHWGHVFSVALAGGGVQGGAAYGVSDRLGAYPLADRVEPHDVAATILHCLGIDPETTIHDNLGRPFPASRGKPIQAILC
ncbi:MAG: hypothetical protein KatS3mg109_1726 [Pirellulaceae bacterium]|nr:MAG: hypothetical protein KatS3mg109_1726 [Pirellulaceae bacterium]